MLHLRRLEGIEGTQKTYFFHFDVLKSESRISCKKVGGRKQKEAQELSGVIRDESADMLLPPPPHDASFVAQLEMFSTL